MTTLKAAGWIVQDRAGYAIYGIGKTETEAIEEVKRECGPWDLCKVEMDEDGIYHETPLTEDEVIERDFEAHEATAELLAQIEAKGGAIAWGLMDGIACTTEQEESE